MNSISIKISNNIYTFPVTDPSAVRAFAQSVLTPEIENRIKEYAHKQLEPLARPLTLVTNSTAEEMVAATVATSAEEFMKILSVGMKDFSQVGKASTHS